MRVLGLVLLTVCTGYSHAASAATLAIAHAVIQKFEDGPPVYRPDGFAPGETVNFSFQVEGFSRKEDKIGLKFEGRPVDPAGIPLSLPIAGSDTSTLSPQDKDWSPKFRGNVALPEVLVGGIYRIHLHLSDEIAGTSADKDLEFTVDGPVFKSSAGLEIEDLNFFRSDEDAQPLEVAAYRLQEGVHARFAITGYKHRENGAIGVTYGISLADSAGNVLFSQDEAAQDTTANFYPKPYVPGVLSFSLKPGTSPGEFALKLTAHDAIGNQTAVATRKFRVE